MNECRFCPRDCGIDRSLSHGVCGSGNEILLARASLHMWEEPCVSGEKGSGAVFFSGCALRCDFCQNYGISHRAQGRAVTENRLYDIFFELKAKGANNINLVTADHYLPAILPVIRRANADGLGIPFVLNTSSYLKPSAVAMLKNEVSVYIADYKFSDSRTAAKYCRAPDYPVTARSAIGEMYGNTGAPVLENGLIKSGVIVRIPVLPHNLIDAKRGIRYIHDRYGDNVIMSVMGQFTPVPECKHAELCSPLSPADYDSVIRYASRIGVTNGYMQEPGSADSAFVPEFDCYGV